MIEKAKRNQLANVGNPYQGAAKRVLCVCSAGLLRSPTLANVLHREFGYNTRAVGLTTEYALIPVTEALLVWADEVCVMEQGQAVEIKAVRDGIKVRVLNVPDVYGFMDDDLQAALLEAYIGD